jgi:Glycosyltransferase family 87
MKRAGWSFREIFGQGPAHVITRLPVLLILWYIAIFHTVVLAANLAPRAYRHDFNVFYAAAIALRQHLDPYTVDLVPIGQRMGVKIWPLIHTTDTPTALLLFMPFSLAAPATAHTIWIALNGAAMAAALLLLIRPKYSGLDTRIAFAIGALALLYAPVTENFLFSQRQALILLLLVMVMRSLESGREAMAGMLGRGGCLSGLPNSDGGLFHRSPAMAPALLYDTWPRVDRLSDDRRDGITAMPELPARDAPGHDRRGTTRRMWLFVLWSSEALRMCSAIASIAT